MSKQAVIQAKEARRQSYLSFDFYGWAEFETVQQAKEAAWLLRSVYNDRCHSAMVSKEEPKTVGFWTSGPEAVKSIGKLLEDDGLVSTGWKTTGEERAAVRKLDIQSGKETGHAGKITTRNYRFFFIRAQIGETFNYSESFSWSDVERLAKNEGRKVEYLNGRQGRVSGLVIATEKGKVS